MRNQILMALGLLLAGTGLWIKEPWIALLAVGSTLYLTGFGVFLLQWFGGSRE